MIFFNRIEQISDYYGFKSVNNFAKEGLNYSSAEKLYRLKDENSRPSVDILEDIANKFEFVNMNWFITGRGEMLRNTSKTDEECKVCLEKDRKICGLQEELIMLQQRLLNSQERQFGYKKNNFGVSARVAEPATVG